MTLLKLFEMELRAIFTNTALLLTVFGGVLFYSFLYPLPYAKQLPREQKIILVDLDASQLSRNLARMVDATPQVQIVHQAHSLTEAKNVMLEKKLAGILAIPNHFYRDLLQGRSPTLAYAGDASYFLVYGTVLQGMMSAGKTLAAQVKIKRLLVSGRPLQLAKNQYSSVRLQLHALFNEAGGYVNYVIPAVFILILHQTLIMGVGILGGTQNELAVEGEPIYWYSASPAKLLLVRTIIFFVIYTLLSLYYYGPAFKLYDIPRLANISGLTLLNLPFLLSATFLGIALSTVLPRRELATLVILLSSMPIVFGSGFIWPQEAIPFPVLLLMQFVPAVPAIKAFVMLNQMGATFHQITPLVTQLILLALFYGILAYLLLEKKFKTIQPAAGKVGKNN